MIQNSVKGICNFFTGDRSPKLHMASLQLLTIVYGFISDSAISLWIRMYISTLTHTPVPRLPVLLVKRSRRSQTVTYICTDNWMEKMPVLSKYAKLLKGRRLESQHLEKGESQYKSLHSPTVLPFLPGGQYNQPTPRFKEVIKTGRVIICYG